MPHIVFPVALPGRELARRAYAYLTGIEAQQNFTQRQQSQAG